MIDAAAGTVITDIPLGDCNCVTYSGGPIGVAVTADGKRVYVALAAAADTANNTISFVSVIDTATNTKIASLGANEGIGAGPTSFGIFIQPPQPPAFAGTPGSPNCNGQSVSALTQKFGTFAAAATALGVTVKGLQQEIATFCT